MNNEWSGKVMNKRWAPDGRRLSFSAGSATTALGYSDPMMNDQRRRKGQRRLGDDGKIGVQVLKGRHLYNTNKCAKQNRKWFSFLVFCSVFHARMHEIYTKSLRVPVNGQWLYYY